MSNYTKLTDFASKDALPTGTPAKIVKGTEIDDEFVAIEIAVATKADTASPTFTGTVVIPTADINGGNIDNTVIGATTPAAADFTDVEISGSLTVGGQAAKFVPSGAVFAFAMSTPPTGYLECDGSAVSRTTYADLFTAIGTTWGTGDGSTTFNLPDLRGEFIRGWDNGKGTDSGRTFGSYQADELKAHTHTYEDQDTFVSNASTGSQSALAANSSTTTDTSSTGGTETRPRNYAMMYCIKA